MGQCLQKPLPPEAARGVPKYWENRLSAPLRVISASLHVIHQLRRRFALFMGCCLFRREEQTGFESVVSCVPLTTSVIWCKLLVTLNLLNGDNII